MEHRNDKKNFLRQHMYKTEELFSVENVLLVGVKIYPKVLLLCIL
jgi:hypothetical protein